MEPLYSLRGVHGPNGVTCITFHNGSVYTAGRDGYCRQYHLSLEGRMSELTKFRVKIITIVTPHMHGMLWLAPSCPGGEGHGLD